MSIKDTSLGLEGFFMMGYERIPRTKIRNLRLNLQEVRKPINIQVKDINLGIKQGDEIGRYYFVVSRKKGYSTRYSNIRDLLVYEKLQEDFIDAIIKEVNS